MKAARPAFRAVDWPMKHIPRARIFTTPTKTVLRPQRPTTTLLHATRFSSTEATVPVTPVSCQPVQRNDTHQSDSFLGMTGGQIFHEMMRSQGVECIFGYPGAAILPVFDAIYQTGYFKFILPKHEQGAGHMAQGYARASGKPGVVLVTSGSGATNMVTPMQDALSDGTAMVVFSGQVRTTALGSDAFQEADTIGISRACTKWNVMVRHVDELPQRINEAFEIATTGRPGPVLVDLPHDVTLDVLRKPVYAKARLPCQSIRRQMAAETRDMELEASLARVARLINIARKPVIYAGQGVILSDGGPQLLKQLADRCSIPVTTTLQGLGAFDELDDKSLHMLGLHGTAYANMSVQEADLILALGARFDDRVTMNVAKFAPAAYLAEREGRGGIVHFEMVPKNINKVVRATEAVEGDVATNLQRLLPLLDECTPESKRRGDWLLRIDKWKKKWPLSNFRRSSATGLIQPQVVIEELDKMTADRKDNMYITTGVGQHQMWAAHHIAWRKPRSMITSGGLGTMGYGLPAAIGAKMAHSDALVIDIDGDASFSMTLSELSTAAEFGIGVKVLLLNNEEQGMVTQLQNIYYEDRYAHTHHVNPDFVALSEAMHVPARRVSDPSDLVESLKWLLDSEGPALLEVVTEKKLCVFPTVRSGGGLHEFITYDEDQEKHRRKLIRERTNGVHG